MLRSDQVELYQLQISNETIPTYEILSVLGYIGAVHFFESDENHVPSHERIFIQKIKTIHNTLEDIRFLESELQKRNLEVIYCKNYNKWLEWSRYIKRDKGNYYYYEDIVKQQVSNFRLNYERTLSNFEKLIESRNQLIETCAIYQLVEQTFSRVTNFKLFLGTVDSLDVQRLERIIFRVSRGNCVQQFKNVAEENQDISEQVIDPKSRNILKRVCYLIMLSSTSTNITLDARINKILDSFNAFKYNEQNFQRFFGLLPSQQKQPEGQNADIGKKIEILKNEIRDRNQTIYNNEIMIEKEFEKMTQLVGAYDNGGCSQIIDFKLYCLKERYIFSQMNILHDLKSKKVFRCLAWIQFSREQDVILEMQNLNKHTPHLIGQFNIISNEESKNKQRPTLLRTNAFTEPFQQIVNTYGVPRYREINPSLFTLITFPFLFGIMYGDVAHGSLIFSFSLFLMAQEISNQNSKEWNQVISARYLICLMGFFAIFNGLIYNDLMSLPLNLFGSCWSNQLTPEGELIPINDCTYPFGMDPAWNLGENKLQMYNSLKMKTSIIIGVTQMLLGVFLKGFNCIYFGSMIDFFFEFIPQFLFLTSTFGYMVILIFIKWGTDFTNNTSEAPSILNVMLNYGLKFGEVDGVALFGNNYIQGKVQNYLLITAIICVPWMLYIKPIILYYKNLSHAAGQRSGYNQLVDDHDVELQENNQNQKVSLKQTEVQNKNKQKAHDFTEDFIHQIIETIEFVLGSVSHTASYLRLWALSLAHAQLSEVFFDKTLKEGIQSGNEIGIVIGFMVLALITFGVLLCMDVMECFLHTLRLHWVEFQSKFFKADGFLFEPFSFEKYLEENARR